MAEHVGSINQSTNKSIHFSLGLGFSRKLPDAHLRAHSTYLTKNARRLSLPDAPLNWKFRPPIHLGASLRTRSQALKRRCWTIVEYSPTMGLSRGGGG